MAHPHRRKFRNHLVNPSFQLKFLFYFWVSGVAIAGTFLAFVYLKIDALRLQIAQTEVVDFALQAEVNNIMFEIIFDAAAITVIFSIVSFFYAILITHRIAGPAVAIRAYIEELKRGNYDAVRTLRKYDALHDIMDPLQELAQILKRQDAEKESN